MLRLIPTESENMVKNDGKTQNFDYYLGLFLPLAPDLGQLSKPCYARKKVYIKSSYDNKLGGMEKYFTLSGFMWRIRILQGNTISKGISFCMSKCNNHFFLKKNEFQKCMNFICQYKNMSNINYPSPSPGSRATLLLFLSLLFFKRSLNAARWLSVIFGLKRQTTDK